MDNSWENKDDVLAHYGMPKRSGRYPWGAGENPYQHSGDFLARGGELKKSGMKETQIAESMSVDRFRLQQQKDCGKKVTA